MKQKRAWTLMVAALAGLSIGAGPALAQSAQPAQRAILRRSRSDVLQLADVERARQRVVCLHADGALVARPQRERAGRV